MCDLALPAGRVRRMLGREVAEWAWQLSLLRARL